MFLRKLTVSHFRNLALAGVEFSGNRQFLVGANGQGKTNILEAAGFVTALRSFRVADGKLLISHGQAEAGIAWSLDHEVMGATEVTVRFDARGKRLTCDGEATRRLADHLGRFPAVVFSSQDIQLIRGSPALRRRWLDLTMASMDPEYLTVLQKVVRSLADRNAVLKRGGDRGELSAFTKTLAPASARLVALRTAGLASLGAHFSRAYHAMSDSGEGASLGYLPNVGSEAADAHVELLEAGIGRDLQARTTLSGPHRDDLVLEVAGVSAKDFASEGQQRCVALALRFAQLAWYRERSGVSPVLLADDVLGELDPVRRGRFWASVDPSSQVIATGTEPPTHGAWQVFRVENGTLSAWQHSANP